MKKTNLKKQKGFTLVEVIVVAIIVAALAAVAIPLYNNYVTTSKNNMAANSAGAVASFVGACKGLGGVPGGAAVAGDATGPVTVSCLASPGGTVLNASTIGVPAGIHILIDTTAQKVKTNGTVSTASATTDSPNQEYSF